MMNKPFFSIGIIFKNEIRCLERCLKSLQPIRDVIPCEVVMADTGSTDGSREIAARYADILFDFPWIDDFAAARNAVLDRCSGVWYMSVDADEWFNGDVEELVQFSKTKNIPKDIICYTIRNYKSKDGETTKDYTDFSAMRIMRIASGLRYAGCIHEKFDIEFPSVGQLAKTLFNHDGYYYETKADMETKRQRNLKLLDKKLAEDPNNLQTLVECIDSMKAADSDVVPTETIAAYARRSIELLHEQWERWGHYGAVVYRNAVSVAKMHNLPELFQWAERAAELYPNSLYIRIDIGYYAFARSWDEKRLEDAIRWGELYLTGIADYRKNEFTSVELVRGVLDCVSPYWERRLLIVMAQAWLDMDEPQKTYEILSKLDGSMFDEPDQVEAWVNIAMRLHRVTKLDTPVLIPKFWEQINRPVPSKEMADKRCTAFLHTASFALQEKYLSGEVEKEAAFSRHAYTLFCPLEKMCEVGAFAAMLDEQDVGLLAERMETWSGGAFPVSVLYHALEIGVPFPLVRHPMCIEEMDTLACELVKEPERFEKLVCREDIMETPQQICWTLVLALAAVRIRRWNRPNEDMALVRWFTNAERTFLSLCYSDKVLMEDNIFLLPAVHRFGWCCVRAFDALNSGHESDCIRYLRKGLGNAPDKKAMVEFVMVEIERKENKHRLHNASPELLNLAEQVRAILAQYPADDPSVMQIKNSEVYKKVAWLLEEPKNTGEVRAL